MPDNKVHVYTATREDRLQRLVLMLWLNLTEQQQQDLAPDIEDAGMGWAIPGERDRCLDDYLTFAEIGAELGLSPSAIRNWPDRYGIIPKSGRLKWGDVKELMRKRNLRKAA